MNKAKTGKTAVQPRRSLYLLHPYNACLVTSGSRSKGENVMAVAWIIPVSVDPPLIAMSIRTERFSYRIILESKEFAVNIPTFEMAQKVLFCGRRSGKERDKFEDASLTPQRAQKINAPIIEECIAHLECKVEKTLRTGDHELVVGEIIAAYAEKDCFDEVYNLTRFHPCLHIGKDFFTTCTDNRIEPNIQKM